ncbi:hypothetical protein K440DRAFT_611601 [Wilcoxina mikolae CBS 423.85]|nr:hypothetical protein K440DRAFT_611601 [Wilcoxina mikolae CBS 423.85]
MAPVVIEAATAQTKGLFDEDTMKLMDIETTSIPYGDEVVMDPDSGPPMKLVTHGQLMFMKINIIDKFGQAIYAIDPSPRRNNAPVPTVFPCFGDTYYPGTVGNKSPKDLPHDQTRWKNSQPPTPAHFYSLLPQ